MSPNEANDWEIDMQGLYVATRSFLIRRGYCCANQCRNCPYINWHKQPTWHPLPAETVQFAEVSPQAMEGARRCLMQHEQQLPMSDNQAEHDYHKTMIYHYRLLLGRWEVQR